MSGLSIYLLHASLTGEIGNFIFVMVGALFVVLGNFIHSVKPNYFVGIRLPWTLENADNWRKTHQLGSKVWVIGGILIILIALILPPELTVYVIMGIILCMVAIPAVYSYREFRKNA